MSQPDFSALARRIVQRQQALDELAGDIEQDVAAFWQQAGRIQPGHPAFADLCRAYRIIVTGSDTTDLGIKHNGDKND